MLDPSEVAKKGREKEESNLRFRSFLKNRVDEEDLDEHYKSQLDAYKKAVKLTLGQDAEDALIYHIDIK